MKQPAEMIKYHQCSAGNAQTFTTVHSGNNLKPVWAMNNRSE